MGMMINRRRVYGGKKLPQGAVDMGLPSGTLWAQGNIIKDANGNYAIGEPTDYGCYFSWGNIDGHNEGDGYSFDAANYALTSGSQLTGNIPSDDALHDAAVARIGGGWHMPSMSNIEELSNSSYVTRQWATFNNVNGILFTSIENGNTIFLPASGRIKNENVENITLYGLYWLSNYGWRRASYHQFFDWRNYYQVTYDTIWGLTIRPVYTPNN